jgi:glycosyltransferase involved in cell wall biosynthesis
VEVWLVCHDRVRPELEERYGQDLGGRIHFVKDSLAQSRLYRWTQWMPFQIQERLVEPIIRLMTQVNARPIVRKLVNELSIDIVFDPSVISPKAVSCLYDLGVPVVIGPMCGGIDFPPGFQYLETPFNQFSTRFGRSTSQLLHQRFPGKLRADALLVANDRTAQALPSGYRGQVHHVVESGVDLSIWQPVNRVEPLPGQPTRFVYMARFVEQKGIPFLIEAFKPVAEQTNAVLELIGSGDLFEATKAQVNALNIGDQVNFHGWMKLQDAAELIRDCDVYVVPAIRDCGGCAMLESMAMGLPVIAANWAGPGDYADDNSGLRVDVSSRENFVKGLTEAMLHLAKSPALCRQLGEGSKQRVRENYFDWDAKVDRVLEIFQTVLAQSTKTKVGALTKPQK